MIRPHFAPLGRTDPPPVLVFLEDTSLLDEKVQQSKLAALGRLSASIAHEIRNPVGAMSHAGQLLAESPQLTEEDRRLTTSSAAMPNASAASSKMSSGCHDASVRSWNVWRWAPGPKSSTRNSARPCNGRVRRMQLRGATPEVEVRADPNQLRQIVWNLCENALKHAIATNPDQSVEIRCGRMSGSARPFLEVADRGKGVAPEQASGSSSHSIAAAQGTGLGSVPGPGTGPVQWRDTPLRAARRGRQPVQTGVR